MNQSQFSKVSDMMNAPSPGGLFSAPVDAAAAVGNPYSPGAQPAAVQPSNPISSGANQVGNGLARMTRGGHKDIVGGLTQAARGAMEMAAPVALPAAIIAAPEVAIPGLMIGQGADQGTQAIAKSVGLPDEYADAAGLVAGLAAGTHADDIALPKGGVSRGGFVRKDGGEALQALADKGVNVDAAAMSGNRLVGGLKNSLMLRCPVVLSPAVSPKVEQINSRPSWATWRMTFTPTL
jgi:hypothetical protein